MNEIECETCIKRKTVYCPNHVDCYDTINKPYYQNRIMLLEENKQLKKQYCERTDCSGRIGNSKKVEELEKRLEASERARKEAIEHIKELYDNTDDTTCYDIDKVEKERLLQILDIDKGE